MIKIHHTLCFSLLLFISCKNNTHREALISPSSNIDIANKFVDAFYSFNRDSLASILSIADDSKLGLLYYQKWAECGNYQIVKRGACIQKNDSLVILPVTVKDDLMAALNINFNITDTFHLSIQKGQIRYVQTSSNDLDIYYEAKEWVTKNRPELVEKACEGIWEDGPTPCECVQGMVKGFAEFVKEKQTKF